MIMVVKAWKIKDISVQLTFQFDPCAINENCISSLTFIRSE